MCSKTRALSSLWRGDATGADTPPTSTGSFTSFAPPDMGVVWGAVPYIERELKNYRTTKNPQNQKKNEGSGRQNDDEKATSGSLSRVGDSPIPIPQAFTTEAPVPLPIIPGGRRLDTAFPRPDRGVARPYLRRSKLLRSRLRGEPRSLRRSLPRRGKMVRK